MGPNGELDKKNTGEFWKYSAHVTENNELAGTEALKEHHIDLGQVSSNQEEYRRMCFELGKEGGTFEVTVKQYNDLKEYYERRK